MSAPYEDLTYEEAILEQRDNLQWNWADDPGSSTYRYHRLSQEEKMAVQAEIQKNTPSLFSNDEISYSWEETQREIGEFEYLTRVAPADTDNFSWDLYCFDALIRANPNDIEDRSGSTICTGNGIVFTILREDPENKVSEYRLHLCNKTIDELVSIARNHERNYKNCCELFDGPEAEELITTKFNGFNDRMTDRSAVFIELLKTYASEQSELSCSDSKIFWDVEYWNRRQRPTKYGEFERHIGTYLLEDHFDNDIDEKWHKYAVASYDIIRGDVNITILEKTDIWAKPAYEQQGRHDISSAIQYRVSANDLEKMVDLSWFMEREGITARRVDGIDFGKYSLEELPRLVEKIASNIRIIEEKHSQVKEKQADPRVESVLLKGKDKAAREESRESDIITALKNAYKRAKEKEQAEPTRTTEKKTRENQPQLDRKEEKHDRKIEGPSR